MGGNHCMCLALLVIVAARSAECAFEISSPSGPFTGRVIYCTPTSVFEGPQAGDGEMSAPRTTSLVIFSGDPCDSSTIPADVAGKTVYLPVRMSKLLLISCSLADLYTNFLARNVTAVIYVRINVIVPGSNAWVLFPNALPTDWIRWKSMMLLELQEQITTDGIRLSTYLDGFVGLMNVTVSPDVNQYAQMFSGFPFQFLTRWLPSLIFITTFGISVLYMVGHIIKFGNKLKQKVPAGRTISFPKHVINIWTRVGLLQAIIVIDGLTSLAFGAFLFHYGWCSMNPAPSWIAGLNTLLGGLGITSDVMSARVWNDIRRKVPGWRMEAEGVLTRVSQHHIFGPLLMTIPLAADVFISVTYATRWLYIPSFNMITAVLLIVLQVTVAVYFLYQSQQFTSEIKKTVNSTQQLTAVPKDMIPFLQRFSAWKFRLGVAIVISVLFAPIAATPYVYTPTGWMIFFSVQLNMRGLTSLCRVMMTKPRLRHQDTSGRGKVYLHIARLFIYEHEVSNTSTSRPGRPIHIQQIQTGPVAFSSNS